MELDVGLCTRKRKEEKGKISKKKNIKRSVSNRLLPERYGQYFTYSSHCYESLIEPNFHKCAIESEDKELWQESMCNTNISQLLIQSLGI